MPLVRIALISPPSPFRDTPDPNGLPLGLAMLAAMVRDRADIAIIDAYSRALSIRETIDEALRFNPDIVGISLPFTFSEQPGLEVAKGIKAGLPGTLTVLGGIHASVRSDKLIGNPEIDAVSVGESELTIGRVVDVFTDGGVDALIKTHIEGFNIKNRDMDVLTGPPGSFTHDLDTLPFPAFDLLQGFPDTYVPRLITSRGCLFACPYCASCSYWGRKFRAQSPARVIDDFRRLLDTWGIRRVSLSDDNFNMDRTRARKIAELLIEENMGVEWGTSCHPGLLTKDDLELFRHAGMTGLFVGVESGSPRILESIGRTHNLEKTRELMSIAADLGIETHASFMIGLPEERDEDIEMTLEYARNLNVRTLGFHIFHPLPGSEIGDNPEKYGIEFEIPDINLPGLGAIDSVAPIRTRHLSPMRILDYYYIARGIAEKKIRAVNPDCIKNSG